jgi:FAD/FMN-containing dehydrogenase
MRGPSKGGSMATNTVTNWFGDIVSHPAVIVDANSVDDIVRVMKDPATYPAPVRAVGSNHSTAACGVADDGTLIRMKMNRILNIGADTLTVEAGAVHLAMARALEARGRHQGCILPRRVRPGRLLYHRDQNGSSQRRLT